jgi:hypothetical protein
MRDRFPVKRGKIGYRRQNREEHLVCPSLPLSLSLSESVSIYYAGAKNDFRETSRALSQRALEVPLRDLSRNVDVPLRMRAKNQAPLG